MEDFCQILTIFGKFMKMRKTPITWAVMKPKMTPRGLARRSSLRRFKVAKKKPKIYENAKNAYQMGCYEAKNDPQGTRGAL